MNVSISLVFQVWAVTTLWAPSSVESVLRDSTVMVETAHVGSPFIHVM